MRTDAETIAAVLAGGRADFAELVSRYERVVHAMAMGVLRDHHAAQDICQETFVIAFTRLGALRDRSSFGPWLLTIARNQALLAARRRTREQPLDNSPDPPAHKGNGRLDERAERLLAAIAALPEREGAVVMLKYFAGHSLEQIAAMTDQPLGTVGVQLHRARTHLRERLGEVTG